MLVIGSFLIAVALLGFLEVAALFNRPDAPRWTKSGWIGEAVMILFVFFIGLGAASFINAAATAGSEGAGIVDAGLALGIAAVALVIGRWSAARRTRAGQHRAGTALAQTATSPAPATATIQAMATDVHGTEPPAGGSLSRAA
jgi:hypothetical protein